jgi:hypothetical protein
MAGGREIGSKERNFSFVKSSLFLLRSTGYRRTAKEKGSKKIRIWD